MIPTTVYSHYSRPRKITKCDNCKEEDHCNGDDNECNCECIFESKEDEQSQTVDEVDEIYAPTDSEDVADDHASHDKTGNGKMLAAIIISSGIIISMAYLYDNGMLPFLNPINELIAPDNPIIKETPLPVQDDMMMNFIGDCNMRLTKNNGVVVGGSLECVTPPTQEQLRQAETKFHEKYG